MNFKEIALTIQDEIAIIKFNRPEVMNCVGANTHKELISAWKEFKTNDALKVAIITGEGDRAFCSGGDLKLMRTMRWQFYNKKASMVSLILR